MITLESLKSKKFEKFKRNEIVQYGSITGGIYYTRKSLRPNAGYDRADTLGGPITSSSRGRDSNSTWARD